MTVAFLVEGRLWPRKRAATSGSSLIEVTVKPATGSLALGGQMAFTAAINKHNGHCRQLERQRRAQWRHHAGNDHIRRRVHRACRPAFACHRANHRYQSCRPGKIRHR